MEDRGRAMRTGEMTKAVLTDSHFWIPLIVLLGGVVLLVVLGWSATG